MDPAPKPRRPRLAEALAAAALLLAATAGPLCAQYTGYGLKFGPTLATQRWDNYQQDPLLGYHVDLQVENLSESKPRTLYASLGYHQRGSAIRFRRTVGRDVNGFEREFRAQTLRFVWHNVGLAVGAKQTKPLGNARGHVSVGLRGEVNVGTDLGGEVAEQVRELRIGIPYPIPEFSNRLVAGIDIGGGIDFPLSPTLDGLVELRVSPDFTRQYFQPPFQYFDSFTGNNVLAREETISNVSLELSVGIRWLDFGA